MKIVLKLCFGYLKKKLFLVFSKKKKGFKISHK